MDTPGKYQLVAVDLAGHRSPPVTIDLDVCDRDRGCGCNLGAPGRSAALGTCFILSILLLATRRSRRSKSSIPLP